MGASGVSPSVRKNVRIHLLVSEHAAFGRACCVQSCFFINTEQRKQFVNIWAKNVKKLFTWNLVKTLKSSKKRTHFRMAVVRIGPQARVATKQTILFAHWHCCRRSHRCHVELFSKIKFKLNFKTFSTSPRATSYKLVRLSYFCCSKLYL